MASPIAFAVPVCCAEICESLCSVSLSFASTIPMARDRTISLSRDRNRPLKVFVSERERAEIETRAAATGLSVSAYLRNLGLGFQPHSTLDHEAILALLKVNADQGRLGGLFKLWLSGQSVASTETMEIRKLLIDIEECQRKLKAVIEGLPG